MSNSSDPYPKMERELILTRQCLEILSRSRCRIQVVTKSTLVTRDADLLSEAPAMVAITITTCDDGLAKRIEPQAPSPTERLKAVESLVGNGVPVMVRIDPIIPFVNEDAAKLMTELACLGVKHVTASTFKVKRDGWKRFSCALPVQAEKLKPLYFERGEKAGGCALLPRDLRLKLLANVRRLALSYGIKFAVCREGLSQLNTACCDGSWLLPELER
jgi:DNA repair photolyase